MTRVRCHLTFLVAALAALFVVPVAHGASKYPTVSSVAPLTAGIGDTLTIKGKGFRSGKNKNTVVFRSTTGKTVFSKAGAASSTRIQIVIPSKLMPYMKTSGTTVVGTKFRIRVVAKKLGKKYTSSAKSPTIGPTSLASKGASAASNGDCDADGITNGNESDDDNDLLSDTLETQIGTSTCSPDTDGDGVADGYEYYSAITFNGVTIPFYPIKKPYANPLYDDANIDYDGDGMPLWSEYAAWVYSGKPFPAINYLEGLQWTGGKTPVADAAIHGAGSEDINGDGTIADWEKDVDNDGLTNSSELNGPMSGPDWWTINYSGDHGNNCGTVNPDDTITWGVAESPYPTSQSAFEGTNFVDSDTDGDHVNDGDDDVDEDGFSNAFEDRRPANWCTTYVSNGPFPAKSHLGGANPDPLARTQPFNPCKPIYSDHCHQVIFAGDEYPEDEDWRSPYHPSDL